MFIIFQFKLFQSDDEISYRNKYLMLVTAMKQLQNTFLRAQQNAERNVKGKIYLPVNCMVCDCSAKINVLWVPA